MTNGKIKNQQRNKLKEVVNVFCEGGTTVLGYVCFRQDLLESEMSKVSGHQTGFEDS